MKNNNLQDRACGNKPERKLEQKRAVNLRKNETIRFQVGLILSMAVVYMAINYYAPMLLDSNIAKEEVFEDEFVLAEETPKKYQVESKEIPKPLKTKNPAVFKISDDQIPELIEEKIIDMDPSEPTPPTRLEDIEEVSDDVDIELPFEALEEIPLFPGCEGLSKTASKACFQEQMKRHIHRHFKYPEFELETGVQGKVFVLFRIDKNGQVGGIQLRGTNKNFEKEAKKIIQKLPRFTPGKQNGRRVRVSYAIPIHFKLH
ncbi:MAG: TonB family protein [Flavobacteriaceae bacterium]|nr:TonB family protein [Flavobacteriaceae bacterium]